ncbi:MFS transporter [Ligilactobacillus acidipiscis]|uniref:MFS transporter n=1 Tax=Ligilactobacillus acidipiscis TaxID=89059 RepID=UPI002FDA078F
MRIRNKIFLLINTLLSMGSGLITPIITLYIHNDLHKSLVTAGYVLLLYSGMIAVGYLLGGRLFDVWQPEALVYIGGTLAIFFLLALFPKWPFLITFLALYGAGQGLWRSAFSGYMAIIQENDHDIFNNNYWTANIGMGIATLLAGYLYSVSVHLVFVVTALLFTSGLFIFARYFSLPKKQDHIEQVMKSSLSMFFPLK